MRKALIWFLKIESGLFSFYKSAVFKSLKNIFFNR
jgi:hypothetical protein